jgi:hypothetical protein
MLAQALHYRMTGAVDKNSHQFRTVFLATVEKNWLKNWPDGLYISTADIPDRDPLSVTVDSSVEDPMTLRQPRAYWKKPLPHLMAGVIRQLSEFIAEVDVRRINKRLLASAISKRKQTHLFNAQCKLEIRQSGMESSISFNCINSKQLGFSIRGLARLHKNAVQDGYINAVSLLDSIDQGPFQLGEGDFSETDEENTLEFRLLTNRTGLAVETDTSRFSARLGDGRLLEKIQIHWENGQHTNSAEIDAQAKLVVLDDYGALQSAIDEITSASLLGKTQALSGTPFQRQNEIRAVLDSLGLENIQWVKFVTIAKTVTQNILSTKLNDQNLQPLQDYCSDCHSNTRRFPPGFLQGDSGEIELKLASCAGEILSRINQWNLQIEDRQFTPMPPPYWLLSQGVSESEWVDSQAFTQLQFAGRQLLLNRSDKPAVIDLALSCLH